MDRRRTRDPGRAQSSVIGVVLIIGMTLAAASAVVMFGGAAMDDGRQQSEIGQAEQAMTQFDSRTAQVALGDSDVQTVRLGQNGGQYRVEPDEGRIVLTHENRTSPGSVEEIYNDTLGAFVYEKNGVEIAYQGGGVWRKDNGRSALVSPPEFHYRSGTLTLPIVKTNGTGSAAGSAQARVAKQGQSRPVFPNASDNYDGHPQIEYGNPLPNGSVYVEIESKYCEGWQSYFESRTEGGIQETCSEDREGTVRLELAVPFEGTFEDEVVVSSDYEQSGGKDEPNWKKSTLPSVSSQVDDRIEACQSGNCEETWPNEFGNETYYLDGDVEFNDETFDTTDGNVTIVVDGDLEIKGDNDVEGEGKVEIFLKGEYNLKDSINDDGDATQLQMFVHSSTDVITHQGNSHLTGIVYAPNTKLEQKGSGVVKGAVFADVVSVSGSPSSTFEPDTTLEGYRLKLVSGQVPITFLHVTENEVGIDLG